jgi:hypothetical protein
MFREGVDWVSPGGDHAQDRAGDRRLPSGAAASKRKAVRTTCRTDRCGSRAAHGSRALEEQLIILGIILLIIGLLVASLHVLFYIGIVLLVVGLILAIAGFAGREIGGRKHYY